MNGDVSRDADARAALHRIAAAQIEPSADLWPRIEVAHALRVRRRRQQRFAAGGILGITLIAAIAAGGLHLRPGTPGSAADIDWQARAQALELQLRTLERDGAATVSVAGRDVDPAAAELADTDHRLQAAYEHEIYANELASLWKRRSELLDAMIAARKEGLAVTRI